MSKIDLYRRMICQYHSALSQYAPSLAAAYASAAAAMGEPWVAPIEQVDASGEVLPSSAIGRAIGVPAGTIRAWMHRGLMLAYTVEEARRAQAVVSSRRRRRSDASVPVMGPT